jgi:hypothetical protein
MQDRVPALHPRKLYEMLRACPSAETRAAAALSFVRGCTGAKSGFLLVAREGELVIAARVYEGEVPRGLVEDATRTWSVGPSVQTNVSETLDASALAALDRMKDTPTWVSPSGEAFERRLLAAHRGSRWARAGLLLLKAAPGDTLLPIRHAHIEALCNALIDSGDVAEG